MNRDFAMKLGLNQRFKKTSSKKFSSDKALEKANEKRSRKAELRLLAKRRGGWNHYPTRIERAS